MLVVALTVATGRTVIRARTYKSHGFTIDDGFFLLALITFLAGTVMTYIDIPHFYLEEYVETGLENPPANFIPILILGEKLEDAVTSLLGTAIVSIKFSFLFFFRALLRQQKKMMYWWRCIFALLVLTAFIMIFAIFIDCDHWNQEIFRQSTSFFLDEITMRFLLMLFEVECVVPAAHARQNVVLKSSTILDILTDAFRKSWRPQSEVLISVTLTNKLVISVPVLLLWNVRIGIRRKLALGGILSLSVCTMIVSIIKVAGGANVDGGVDPSWVFLWYVIEAAVAIIVVSFTAFRALFVAHQALKYRIPVENPSTWNSWSRTLKSSSIKELPEVPLPVFSDVRTHIRKSQYGGGSYDRSSADVELPIQGPGIIMTQDIHSEKVTPCISICQ